MTMTLVSTTTLATATASITFSAIPQTATDLILLLSGRSTASVVVAGSLFTLNGSNAAEYAGKFLYGNGSAAASETSGTTVISGASNIPGANATANTFGSLSMIIANYTLASAKSISFEAVSENNGTVAYQSINAASWNSSSAVTSISITTGGGNYAAGSTASLYTVTKGSGGASVA